VPPKPDVKGKWIDDPGGRGTQIVREVRACPRCAGELREVREHPPPMSNAA
jgi:hypothetical protein